MKSRKILPSVLRKKAMNNTLPEVAQFLRKAKEVSIFSHVNPDGDAIGSMCALASALEKIGVRCELYNTTPIPQVYKFLPKANDIKLYQGEELADVIVIVDSATLERTDLHKYPAQIQGKTLVDIDHHLGNDGYGSYNYVQAEASANCENVYKVICAMGVEIDEEIATALYLGLSTDSGSFKFDAVTAETHRIAAELLEKGARMDLVRLYIYETVSPAKLMLQKYVYANLNFAAQGKIAWSALDKQILEESQADGNDIDGIVNILKNIEGVELAILFREKDGSIKASFRSKKVLDVNELAKSFGGGGHKRASGATIYSSMQDAIAQVLAQAENVVGEVL